MDDLISVIVPVYNVEKYVKKCVDSIIAQTYRNLEIILVDDGSTDSSGRICDELASIDKRIIVIHKPNGGLSDARNAGISIARGKYLGFVDGDDLIHPQTYEILLTNALKCDAEISEGGYITSSKVSLKILRKIINLMTVLCWNHRKLSLIYIQINIIFILWHGQKSIEKNCLKKLNFLKEKFMRI